MTDQAAAARDRLTLAARTSVTPAVSNELEPAACFAAGQLDALIGIGHAVLSLCPLLEAIRSELADISAHQHV